MSIQQAWVVFDAATVCALSGLAWLVRRDHRLAQTLSVFLAGATLTDFLLTTVQAMTLHGELTGWSALFVAAGVAGPLLATLFLGTLAAAAPLTGFGARGSGRFDRGPKADPGGEPG